MSGGIRDSLFILTSLVYLSLFPFSIYTRAFFLWASLLTQLHGYTHNYVYLSAYSLGIPYRTNVGGRKVWWKCCKYLLGRKSLVNLQFTKKPYKNVDTVYHKWGKICWAKLPWFLWFLRVPQKFSCEYLAIVK